MHAGPATGHAAPASCGASHNCTNLNLTGICGTLLPPQVGMTLGVSFQTHDLGGLEYDIAYAMLLQQVRPWSVKHAQGYTSAYRMLVPLPT